MISIRTICCKLAPTTEQFPSLDRTCVAFATVCDYVAEACRVHDTTDRHLIQKLAYAEMRTNFRLPSNLTIRAIARACAALKVEAKRHSTFAPTSVDFNCHTFKYREADVAFRLTTVDGAIRVAACLGEYQRKALAGTNPTSATLVKRGGCYYLHVQVKTKSPDVKLVADVIGIDLGICTLVADSDGKRDSGDGVEKIRRKHKLQRGRLQRKNTRGAKKKLKRIAGKEARFRRHSNHVLSKRIVQTAERTGRGIALENLRGIRKRVTARGGDARHRLGGWAFSQLRMFIEYKAALAGVAVVTVNPRNTSRTCAECGDCKKANRTSQDRFFCKACDHTDHADTNAARNIRALGIRNLPKELAG